MDVFKFIHNYLTNRNQRTKINSIYSLWEKNSFGISQGFALRPTSNMQEYSPVFCHILCSTVLFDVVYVTYLSSWTKWTLQAMYMTIHISLHPIILMMFLNCIIKTPLNYLYGSLLAKGNLRVINTIFFQMNHGNSKANENSWLLNIPRNKNLPPI